MKDQEQSTIEGNERSRAECISGTRSGFLMALSHLAFRHDRFKRYVCSLRAAQWRGAADPRTLPFALSQLRSALGSRRAPRHAQGARWHPIGICGSKGEQRSSDDATRWHPVASSPLHPKDKKQLCLHCLHIEELCLRSVALVNTLCSFKPRKLVRLTMRPRLLDAGADATIRNRQGKLVQEV